jgi:hypothetical protein
MAEIENTKRIKPKLKTITKQSMKKLNKKVWVASLATKNRKNL